MKKKLIIFILLIGIILIPTNAFAASGTLKYKYVKKGTTITETIFVTPKSGTITTITMGFDLTNLTLGTFTASEGWVANIEDGILIATHDGLTSDNSESEIGKLTLTIEDADEDSIFKTIDAAICDANNDCSNGYNSNQTISVRQNNSDSGESETNANTGITDYLGYIFIAGIGLILFNIFRKKNLFNNL